MPVTLLLCSKFYHCMRRLRSHRRQARDAARWQRRAQRADEDLPPAELHHVAGGRARGSGLGQLDQHTLEEMVIHMMHFLRLLWRYSFLETWTNLEKKIENARKRASVTSRLHRFRAFSLFFSKFVQVSRKLFLSTVCPSLSKPKFQGKEDSRVSRYVSLLEIRARK